jgi:phosphoribosyl 1,2-cyclic phosphate phosphodiesterase
MIGCNCPVCTSTNPRNKRRRASISVEAGGVTIIVDTPPDFREQALQYKIARVDAVLFTHSHADHVFGFDDIRRFNTMQQSAIPAYGTPGTIADLKRIFDYIVHGDETPDLYRPKINFIEVAPEFDIGPLHISPIEVTHGKKPTVGYLFKEGAAAAAYVPDCLRMSDEAVARLRGIDVMILDGLRPRPHKTHLTFADSIALLRRIGARTSYTTHMNHDLDHDATEKAIAATDPSIHLSFDGLVIDI